jgi:phosphoglycolate phosphatase
MNQQGTHRAIIFDWDLTLWNSWDIHRWLMERTAEALGVEAPTAEAIAREFHRPFLEHLAWFLGPDQQRVIEVYVGLYRDVVGEKGWLYPGIAEALGQLKEQGFRLAIFSDKRHAFGVCELEQTGLKGLLEQTLFLHDGRPYKPDPVGLQQVMRDLQVTPEETLYIGDSHNDVRCAHRAGVRSAAALWGCINREQVLAQEPHLRLETVDHISTLLGPG